MLKAMGRGGIVSDGCRGKLHESMINFLFVDGLSGDTIYWDTYDMQNKTKDGDTLADAIIQEAEEINAAAGEANKVRTVTTDRAAANKTSWEKCAEHGIEGGPDSVHVHASMVGDVYKHTPWMEEAFKESFSVFIVVKCPVIYLS